MLTFQDLKETFTHPSLTFQKHKVIRLLLQFQKQEFADLPRFERNFV